MEEKSVDIKKVLELIESQEKLVAMIAPSFPVDFSYPEIVGKLKRLGFEFVVEVSLGAMEVNKKLLELVCENPKKRYITSPCPVIVRLIRQKYPRLVKFLTPNPSPMIETAKIVNQKYPEHKPVFIGPCIAKKLEASEDYPELGVIVLTYRELSEIFKEKEIKKNEKDFFASFDLIGPKTRLYPISGGLSQSAGITENMVDEEYDVISGIERVLKVLDEFEANQRLKILDILNCDGGCLSGPGVISKLSIDKKREKIITHWASTASNQGKD